MAFYMEGNDEWKRQQMLRNRTYFPNANPGSGFRGTYSGTTGPSYYSGARDQGTGFTIPGVAEGQERMAQIANTSTYKSRRAAGSMIATPSGGSMFVPYGQQQPYLDKSEIQGRLAAPAAYAQGFGEVSRPVLPDFSGYAPERQPQGGFGFLAGNLARSALNQFTPQRGMQRLGQIGTFAANLFNTANSFLAGGRPTQSTQSQNFYAYNPSPVPMKPNRYFDNY